MKDDELLGAILVFGTIYIMFFYKPTQPTSTTESFKYINQPCPSDKPFYNPLTAMCGKCPGDTKYNPSTKMCECRKSSTPFYKVNTNTPSSGLCVKECPSDTLTIMPDNICVKCPSKKPDYNPTTNTCVECPLGKRYNKKNKRCEQQNSS